MAEMTVHWLVGQWVGQWADYLDAYLVGQWADQLVVYLAD